MFEILKDIIGGGKKAIVSMYSLLHVMTQFVLGILAIIIVSYTLIVGPNVTALLCSLLVSIVGNLILASIAVREEYYYSILLRYDEYTDSYSLSYVKEGECVTVVIPVNEITGRKKSLDGFHVYGRFVQNTPRRRSKIINSVYIDNTLDDAEYLYSDCERSNFFTSVSTKREGRQKL